MRIERINEEQVGPTIQGASHPVVLDFWMDDCPPCNMMEPKLKSTAGDFEEDVGVFQVKVSEDSPLLETYEVEAMPTLLFFDDGREVDRLEGIVSKQELEEIFEAMASS